jgi:aldose 1-epimerase
MHTSQQFCFTHSNGEDIYLFTLRNTKGTEVIISNYGAIINAFKLLNADGTFNDIVLGFDKMGDYLAKSYLEQYPWFGCAVGRYSNRIKNAVFSIEGKEYNLTKNNNNDQLHGGALGFDKKVWQFVSSGETPEPFLELKYVSVDGEEGFPGNLETLIRFELTNENELSYEYKATCDRPTAVNLTHHGYFNLNNGKGTIEDHEVKIYSSQILEQDDKLVATGEITAVANTAYDFREFYRIGEGLKRIEEYDKSYVVEKRNDKLVAEARSLQSNLLLQVYSTEPIVHFYTGKWIPVVKGKNGNQYKPLSGLCLETHIHPNAVNIPHFPNTILRPGETYYQKTIYKIIS